MKYPNKKEIKSTLAFFLIFLISISCNAPKEVQEESLFVYESPDTYYGKKYILLKNEENQRFDSDIGLLDSIEEKANLVFKELVETEKQRVKEQFPPSKYFFDIKKVIEISPFYNMIQNIPKGAVLSGHFLTMGDYNWLVNMAFTMSNCYIYLGGDNKSWINKSLRFFKSPPNSRWRSLQFLDKVVGEDFKEEVRQLLILSKEDYPYNNIIEEYGYSLRRIEGLLSYRPFFREYFKRICEDLINEKVNYIEIYSSFNGMYDLDREYFNPEQEMDLYVSVRNELQKTHPYFNFKIIYNVSNSQKNKKLEEHYEIALNLYEKFPEMFAGFDFAQKKYDKEELKDLIEIYFKIKSDPYYADIILPLFFNPGEEIKERNEGIYDAVLLKSKRIGYGYEISKSPVLMKMIKENDIAIELSPISNQVLEHSKDLRDHPAQIYINYGIPIVLGASNKGIMNFKFSHQFYESILAWNLDLKGIKKLILNSYDYSINDEEEKNRLKNNWNNQWDVFIQELLNNSKKYKN